MGGECQNAISFTMTGGRIFKGKFRQTSPDTSCTSLGFFLEGKTCFDFPKSGEWGVVYFDQLSGDGPTQKLVKLFSSYLAKQSHSIKNKLQSTIDITALLLAILQQTLHKEPTHPTLL